MGKQTRKGSPERTPQNDGESHNNRLHTLAEVADAFALVGSNYQGLVEKIAKTAADFVGDGCTVTLVDDDGESLVNVACSHRDQRLEIDYQNYLSGLKISVFDSESISALVVRTGEMKMADVSPETMVRKTDDILKPIVAQLNVHSYLVVPIHGKSGVIGTLSLMRSSANHSYTHEDAVLLQFLADRAGTAIENARF